MNNFEEKTKYLKPDVPKNEEDEKQHLHMDLVNQDWQLSELLETPELQQLKERVLPNMRIYRKRIGKENKTLRNLKDKINYEINKRKQYSGTTPTPNTVVRNTYYTKEHIAKLDKINLREGATNGYVISQEFEEVLATVPARYILDAIGSYVKDYWDYGPTEMMYFNEKKYYIIRDTFDRFCARADIKGADRRLVKEVLFPRNNTQGLLERVKFIVPDNGEKSLLEMRFVSARLTLKQERKNRLSNEDESAYAFEMDVHAGIYSFLEKRNKLKRGEKCDLKEGYQYLPKALTSKVRRSIEFMMFSMKKYDLPYKNYVDQRDVEKYSRAMSKLIDKWNTGKQNRKTDMQVTWKELSDERLLPKNTKKRDRRRADMEILTMLAQFWLDRGEAFEDCYDIFRNHLTIIFRISPPKELYSTSQVPRFYGGVPHKSP